MSKPKRIPFPCNEKKLRQAATLLFPEIKAQVEYYLGREATREDFNLVQFNVSKDRQTLTATLGNSVIFEHNRQKHKKASKEADIKAHAEYVAKAYPKKAAQVAT